AHHGIAYRRVPGEPRVPVEAYRATKVTYQPTFEGRARVALEGAWAAETRTLERGAIFVPIAQPLGRLVLHLFDPDLPDSLAQWGHFNAVFERKEYMEPYVAEAAARERAWGVSEIRGMILCTGVGIAARAASVEKKWPAGVALACALPMAQNILLGFPTTMERMLHAGVPYLMFLAGAIGAAAAA